MIIKNTSNSASDSAQICILYVLGIQTHDEIKEQPEKKKNHLDGNWYVYELKDDNTVLKLKLLEVRQEKEKISFWISDNKIADGYISDNIIHIKDFLDYGISRIYVSTDDCLKSEVPLTKQSNGLVFIKKEVIDLSGMWNVASLTEEGIINELNPLSVKQVDNKITFWEGANLVSEGYISNETIYIDDFQQLGISKVFILSNERLESEKPLSDESEGIIFIKQRKTDLNGLWQVIDTWEDGTESGLMKVEIIQDEQFLTIWKDEERISEGFISDDKIYLDDFEGFGISKIFILSDDELTSEIPLSKVSKGLHFRRL